MSNKLPWMPLDIPAYRNDTSHLTTLQHGGYMLLLMHYWCHGPLPDDDDQLAAIAKMDAKTWRVNQKVIRQFFTANNGELHQKRADRELEKANDISAKRREAANTRHHPNANAPPKAHANARANAPPKAGANGGAKAPHTVPVTEDLTTVERKEDLKRNPLLFNGLEQGSTREKPPPDGLDAVLAEAGVEQPKPGVIEKTVGAEIVAMHVRRTAKACEMHLPYGTVRSRSDQIDAALGKLPPVVDGTDYRWQPVDPVRTVEEQLVELERMMRAEAVRAA